MEVRAAEGWGMQWLVRKIKRLPASNLTERTQAHGRAFGLVSTVDAMIRAILLWQMFRRSKQTVVNISFFGLHLLLTFNQSETRAASDSFSDHNPSGEDKPRWTI